MMHVVATAGHVDHGKSTLLRRLTGMEPDRWDEEQRRGLTIDLGFAWTTLDGPDGTVTVAFVDVPGHQRFIPNMLAGAGSIAVAMLVVAADDGWSAQTTEHVAILDLLDVRGVVTVVTKTSLVSEARLADVLDDVAARLARTSLADAPVVAVDSLTGDGIPELVQTLVARLGWVSYDIGPGVRRLWIDRAFTIPGAGTVVTGTMHGGPLAVGQEVHHTPSGRPLRIRGLHALGKPVDEAPAGTRVAVNLSRVPVDQFKRGDALLADEWLSTTTADVMVRSIAAEPVQTRGAWHLHIGTAEVPVRIRPMLDQIDPEDTGPARLELAHPLPLRYGDRFVLRSVGIQATAAGGRVLDPKPAPRAKGMLARIELAERLDTLHGSDEADAQLVTLLELHNGHLPERQARATLDIPHVGDCPDVVQIGTTLVLTDTLLAWRDAALETTRRSSPERGVNITEVAVAVENAGCPQPLRRAVLDHLCAQQHLHAHGDILTLPETTSDYLQARTRRQEALVERLSREPLNPPDLDEITLALQIMGTELQELFDDSRIIQLDNVTVSTTAVELAHHLLHDTFDDRGFTAAEARDAWQTTRKYAVPILEYLARTGVTTFDGTHHHLTPTAGASSTDTNRSRNVDR